MLCCVFDSLWEPLIYIEVSSKSYSVYVCAPRKAKNKQSIRISRNMVFQVVSKQVFVASFVCTQMYKTWLIRSHSNWCLKYKSLRLFYVPSVTNENNSPMVCSFIFEWKLVASRTHPTHFSGNNTTHTHHQKASSKFAVISFFVDEGGEVAFNFFLHWHPFFRVTRLPII